MVQGNSFKWQDWSFCSVKEAIDVYGRAENVSLNANLLISVKSAALSKKQEDQEKKKGAEEAEKEANESEAAARREQEKAGKQ